MKNLSHYRKSYEKLELLESNIPASPMELFASWFADAEKIEGEAEVNAMTLSTLQDDGFPKSRIVLLKEFNRDGFVFYTNYESEKGRAIKAHPKVCLSFFWPGSERQVIIKGIASKVSPDVSDAYFAVRPKGSQLGALASNQSEVIPNRDYIDNKLEQLSVSTSNPVKRPGYWGGYTVKPVSVEFWQGRANRLHDRIRYSDTASGWKIDRLSP